MSKLLIAVGLLGAIGCTPKSASDAPASPTTTIEETSTTVEAEKEVSAAATPATPSAAAKVAPPPSELCAQIEPGDLNDPVAITNLQFHRPMPIPFDFDSFNDDEEPFEHLIGCLTNQSATAIAGVELVLNFAYEQGSGFAVTMVDFPGDYIAPGQTVPFRHQAELDPEITALTVAEVTTLEPMPGYEEYAFQPLETFATAIAVVHVPAKAPAGEPSEAICTEVEPAPSEQPIALSSLQIYELPKDPYDFDEYRESVLIGCVTNQSAEAIDGFSMTYSSDRQNFAFSTILMPEDKLAPGATLPFKKFGEILPDTDVLFVHQMGGVEFDITVNR
ncbi:MAG: hypothetical protein F6K00_03960 [Leptolyngbya sp. SIOISBB]|nr:hypothetical protein [Leptolyngbya sp. SIOISBB]